MSGRSTVSQRAGGTVDRKARGVFSSTFDGSSSSVPVSVLSLAEGVCPWSVALSSWVFLCAVPSELPVG